MHVYATVLVVQFMRTYTAFVLYDLLFLYYYPLITILLRRQVKRLPTEMLYKFACIVAAIHNENKDDIISAFSNLGIQVSNPSDRVTIHKIAVTMLDTRSVPGI